MTSPLLQAQHIHFIGIKGWGMTALAQILKSLGKHITGSDVNEKFLTDAILAALAIPVVESFHPDNIPPETEVIIASAAWGEDNPEIKAARARGIAFYHYPQALGEISQLKKSIGVAGTHGKTTTTALLALALADLGKDPLAIVGSQVPQFNNMNARSGKGEYFVAETCEYRRHFLNFHPFGLIITNIEEDHLDYFHDLSDIISAFKEYVTRLPDNGILVACIDSPAVKTLLSELSSNPRKVLTYGESPEADIRMVNYTVGNELQSFQVQIGDQLHAFEMLIPGKHNCLNATSVIAMCYGLFYAEKQDQLFSTLQQTIKNFASTTRRLQRLGNYGKALVYDDFGHHPTEIKATLNALKAFYPERKLIVSFMPHTYSRTQALLEDFAQAFSDADEVIIHDIYASAREKPIPGVTGDNLAKRIGNYHPQVKFLTPGETEQYIVSQKDQDALFLTIGAGDNWKISHSLMNYD
ncbi:MAG: UDP-N-acetylmuramate--L-alanine ligase [Candidatus Abawacabacteria bacterium]|nr:UDP-N-acetylmuramate--L-alanine ligase [Candidatus Abawacabacteria bacterium]